VRQLLIETSTERGVIACVEDEKILFCEELPFGLNQSKHLIPDLAKHSIDPKKIDCLGVGIGPGSYTGIRIGVSVAQALAFAWNLPLVGVCSLNAFVPSEQGLFAAILDARIGGAYVRKGIKKAKGVEYLSVPEVCPLDNLGKLLMDVTVLVSPHIKMIKSKLDQLYPANSWNWEEVSPSVIHFSQSVSKEYLQGNWIKEGHLELMYLRETEAEREKSKRDTKVD
jgi:tRNA threonylcarbamoyladenosine biosynthesis protein TsaB